MTGDTTPPPADDEQAWDAWYEALDLSDDHMRLPLSPRKLARAAFLEAYRVAVAAERARIRNVIAGEIVLRSGFTSAGDVLKFVADLLDGAT